MFGWREVSRCLDSGIAVEEIFVRDIDNFSDAERLDRLAKAVNAEVIDVVESVFSSLTYGNRDDAVIAIARRPERKLEGLDLPANCFCLVVESIEKPGNLGAIFRSCDGAGVDAVIIANPLTDLFHPNSVRSSMGTVFSVPSAIAEAETVKAWLESKDMQILATMPESVQNYFDWDFDSPTAIVLGNEATGLSDVWRGVESIGLPMLGIADSLNVSVTASILAYENRRQRSKPKKG